MTENSLNQAEIIIGPETVKFMNDNNKSRDKNRVFFSSDKYNDQSTYQSTFQQSKFTQNTN
jgi:hypothetical protein